jgi:hypothetical protein
MSMFKLIKYSSIIFFLGKHRGKLFRSTAVLLFALVTSLLYEDVRVFLTEQHPETLIYALVAKIGIVYGSLAFVLLQFRPDKSGSSSGEMKAAALGDKKSGKTTGQSPGTDRLDALADLDQHQQLRSRYDRILAKASQPDTTGAASKTPPRN